VSIRVAQLSELESLPKTQISKPKVATSMAEY